MLRNHRFAVLPVNQALQVSLSSVLRTLFRVVERLHFHACSQVGGVVVHLQVHQNPACNDCSITSVVSDLDVWLTGNHVPEFAACCFAMLPSFAAFGDPWITCQSHLMFSVHEIGQYQRNFYCPINRLQFVIKKAARLIFSARRRDHVTPLLEELHWLRACVNEYISNLVSSRTAVIITGRRLWPPKGFRHSMKAAYSFVPSATTPASLLFGHNCITGSFRSLLTAVAIRCIAVMHHLCGLL